MSFRTVRYAGLGIMLLIVVLISLLSYKVMSSTAQKLEDIVIIEEVKMRKWHSLFEIIDHSKNSLYDYSMGRKEIIASVNLHINRALKKVEEVKKLTTDNYELADIDQLVKELKTYRQAVFSYGLEIKEGYKGGTSANEMEKIALDAAENITHLGHAALETITNRIDENNKSILKTTNISRKILGIVLIVSISFTFLVAFFMSRAIAGPVKELVKKTSSVADGDLTQTIDVQSDDELGKLAGAFNIMIKKLKEQKEQLVDKRYVDSIITNMMDALIVASPDKKIKTVNRAACILLRYKEEELINKNVLFLFPREERTHPQGTVFDRLIDGGDISDYETSLWSKDGRSIPVLISGSVIRDKAGNLSSLLCTAKDISRLKESELSLIKQSQVLIRSNTELQRIVQIASHDLQEPLRMVTSYVQLLAKRYKGRLDKDADDFIHFAENGAGKMRMLIKGLLAYSRIGTHGRSFELFESEDILKKVLTNLQKTIEESGAEVTYDQLPIIMADDEQMFLLFQNLINNALKFHGNERPRVHISAEEDRDSWVFSVKDNGIGIEKKYEEKVFHIFKRLNSEPDSVDVNIGLAVCKRIVERHGGRIWVESEKGEGPEPSGTGQGSTFYFSIPREGRYVLFHDEDRQNEKIRR